MSKININNLHVNRLVICIVVYFNYVTQFINTHNFWYWNHVFLEFIFRGSNKSFNNNRFSFIMRWNISILLLCSQFLSNLLPLSNGFLNHVLRRSWFKIFSKMSIFVIPFLSFKGTAQKRKKKISITNIKRTNFFFILSW